MSRGGTSKRLRGLSVFGEKFMYPSGIWKGTVFGKVYDTCMISSTNNHLFYYGRRDCRTPLFCEILLAVLTRLLNPFEGQLGSYRWDWNSLRRGSDNLFGIGIGRILFDEVLVNLALLMGRRVSQGSVCESFPPLGPQYQKKKLSPPPRWLPAHHLSQGIASAKRRAQIPRTVFPRPGPVRRSLRAAMFAGVLVDHDANAINAVFRRSCGDVRLRGICGRQRCHDSNASHPSRPRHHPRPVGPVSDPRRSDCVEPKALLRSLDVWFACCCWSRRTLCWSSITTPRSRRFHRQRRFPRQRVVQRCVPGSRLHRAMCSRFPAECGVINDGQVRG